MGTTGSGKSTFMKAATGHNDVTMGHGLKSYTKEVTAYEVPGTNVVLVDTPGFDDTYEDDYEVLEKIAVAFDKLDSSHTRGLIYMHDINDPRMKGGSMKNLKLLKKIVGKNQMSSCCLVTTKWSTRNFDQLEAHEDELLNKENFWGHLRGLGARISRFWNGRESAEKIWKPFTSMSEIQFQITKKYQSTGRYLTSTSAGKLITQHLYIDLHRIEQDLRDINERRQEARERPHKDSAKYYEQERKKFQARYDKLRAEKKRIEQEKEQARKNASKMRARTREDVMLALEERRDSHKKNRQGCWVARGAGLVLTLATLPMSSTAMAVGAAAALGIEGICQTQKAFQRDQFDRKVITYRSH